jgi:hypothetical protein
LSVLISNIVNPRQGNVVAIAGSRKKERSPSRSNASVLQ